ncbi:histidine kinase [Sphingomonas sp.]|uniref:sensor histidine kinase n=1 Tax=Sphingomonas sp. TaxID=28214 RepID=UPI001816713A|nr:histidine kinase [Sphingomonas sp.]MBA3511428.1 histidine kinase [Sphingomonas sp.]
MNNHSEISAARVLPRRAAGSRFADWPLALKSILGFWLVYYVTVVARSFLSPDPGTILFNRSFTLIIGIVLTFVVYSAIKLFARRENLRRLILVGVVASFLAAAVQAAVLIAVDRYLEKPQDELRFTSREGYSITETGNMMRVERDGQEPLVLTFPRIGELQPWFQFRVAADSTVTWFFFFAAWSAFYIAMLSQAQALGAQRRVTEAESAARAAQVRALRYQVNPHFLFNTLNSLSSLVMSGRPQEAEEMILKLSTFFRSSLSLDPSADVTLAEEIALQRLYLDIERVRFPRRLKVEIDVPRELESALLPALVLQPVVENAIKYGVSPTRDKVVLRIVAREAGPGRFVVEISNSGNHKSARQRDDTPEGTGVGLGNVCERLRARFGEAAQCEFGPIDGGGYRVVMTLPLDRADG